MAQQLFPYLPGSRSFRLEPVEAYEVYGSLHSTTGKSNEGAILHSWRRGVCFFASAVHPYSPFLQPCQTKHRCEQLSRTLSLKSASNVSEYWEPMLTAYFDEPIYPMSFSFLDTRTSAAAIDVIQTFPMTGEATQFAILPCLRPLPLNRDDLLSSLACKSSKIHRQLQGGDG